MPVDDGELAEVLAYLKEMGATPQQLAEAAACPVPARVATDMVLSRSLVLTARDVAAKLDLSVEDIAALVRTLGYTSVDPDIPAFSESDVDLFGIEQTIGVDLAHVLTAAMSRIADAAVAAYVQTIETSLSETSKSPTDGPGTGEVARARAGLAAGELAVRLAGNLGSVFIHQLREAVRWQRTAQADVSIRSMARLCVGFVDLVGFTSLSRQVTAADLTKLVTTFESTAFDVTTRHGGRVVKHVGDEVMFVALDASTGVRIAVALVDAFGDSAIRPRSGVAFGELLTLRGDYYGPVVNLASRLTDEAIPGEVLVDAAAADAARTDADAGGELRFEPAGRRMLKGFDEPIAVQSVVI